MLKYRLRKANELYYIKLTFQELCYTDKTMATSFDNQRLHDIAAYNSVMLESVKLYEFDARLVLFRKLKRDLGEVLYKLEYDTLNLMAKKEVNQLVKQIKAVNQGFFSSVAKDVESMFEKFASKAIVSQKKKWVGISLAMENEDDDALDEVNQDEADLYMQEKQEKSLFPLALLLGSGALFAERLLKTPITGLGQTLTTVLEKYNELSNKRLEDLVLKAWSSGYTRDEIMKEILGDPSVKQGKQGAIGTMRAQMNAIIDTALGFAYEQAHSAATSSAGVAKKYIWISIMDGRTSAICIERNRKIYEVNKGPLPPAHANCRSSTAPYNDDNGDVSLGSFESWVSSLSENIQKDIKNYGSIDKSTGKYKATAPMKPDKFFKL